MAAEFGTIFGAFGTAATGLAAAVTSGQVPAINKAVEETAKYTARHAVSVSWKAAETAVSAAGTAACAAAAAATLGQNQDINRAVVNSAENTAAAGLKAANKLVEEANPLNTPNQLSFLPFVEYTRDLPGNIRRWLAGCARDCMSDEPQLVAHHFDGLPGGLHARVYKGFGRKCLAIRGTDNPGKVVQDVLMFVTGACLEQLVLKVISWARREKVDYVTGFSLGGFLAEAAASRLGKDGAAFNSPGGRGLTSPFGNEWSDKTKFEVHLHKLDPVSVFRHDRHIAEPKWHSYDGEKHDIANMARDL